MAEESVLNYTCKRGYWIALTLEGGHIRYWLNLKEQGLSPALKAKFFTNIRHKWLACKISSFIWLLLNRRLLVRTSLHTMKLPSECPVCATPIETLGHCLFHCTMVARVWNQFHVLRHFSSLPSYVRNFREILERALPQSNMMMDDKHI